MDGFTILILVLFLISLIILIIVAIFGIYSLNKYLAIKKKYKGIIDVDDEIINRNADLNKIYKDMDLLKNEYLNGKQVYETLNYEISQMEEQLEMQSFGLYKPHYDFSTSEEFKECLNSNNDNQRRLIKDSRAAICNKQWTIDGKKREGERVIKKYQKLMLRAFNGECDSAMSKIKWNNVSVMERRITAAYNAINKLGLGFDVSITGEYYRLKLEQMKLTYEYERKKQEEKEEQRRIREQIREEERAQREIEKAKKDAESEEKRYQKLLEKVEREREKAEGEKLSKLNGQIATLQQQLEEAQKMKERAISRAQITKSGYVYIISNIGSFGENIFKIGMTRRLEPMDRVKELGDASVPFQFDVHAMIYSDNAPDLEKKLHNHFRINQVNLVNNRKEFFNINIDEIVNFANENRINVIITKLAEARDYRESIAIRNQRVEREATISNDDDRFPDTIFANS